MDDHSFKLANGVVIPAVGYGTGIATGISRLPFTGKIKRRMAYAVRNMLGRGNINYTFKSDYRKDKNLIPVTRSAVESGCRLFDTARAYSFSEEYLGDAIIRSGLVPRDELFIITKATNRAQANARVREDLETSLKNLGVDYVDLYLLHWPQAGTYLTAWKTMEEIYKEGLARAIGICNCHVHHLEALKNVCEIMPMANELECHPLLPQHEVREYCKANGIQLIAHTPTGKMRASAENSTIRDLASKYGVSPAQVILRWHNQLGDVVIPNTTNVDHLKQNLDIFGFTLAPEEIVSMNNIHRGGGYNASGQIRIPATSQGFDSIRKTEAAA